jgi:hypothetical protein
MIAINDSLFLLKIILIFIFDIFFSIGYIVMQDGPAPNNQEKGNQ